MSLRFLLGGWLICPGKFSFPGKLQNYANKGNGDGCQACADAADYHGHVNGFRTHGDELLKSLLLRFPEHLGSIQELPWGTVGPGCRYTSEAGLILWVRTRAPRGKRGKRRGPRRSRTSPPDPTRKWGKEPACDPGKYMPLSVQHGRACRGLRQTRLSQAGCESVDGSLLLYHFPIGIDLMTGLVC